MGERVNSSQNVADPILEVALRALIREEEGIVVIAAVPRAHLLCAAGVSTRVTSVREPKVK